MNTLVIISISILLVVLVVVYYLLKNYSFSDDGDYFSPFRTISTRILRGCSFLVKFGMVLTACALIGSALSSPLALAMAFPIPRVESVQPSSWFDHNHNVCTTIPFGAIVPVDWRPMLPGEKFKQNLTGFCRALSLKAPIVSDIDLKYATFFVPCRLMCDKTADIVSKVETNPSLKEMRLDVNKPTGVPKKIDDFSPIFQPTGSKSFPYIKFDDNARRYFSPSLNDVGDKFVVEDYKDLPSHVKSFLIGGVMDYLGFPVASYSDYLAIDNFVDGDTAFSDFTPFPLTLLPLYAYHQICNHFFIDDFQRREYSGFLVTPDTSLTGEVNYADVSNLFTLRFSSYESDYFTKSTSTSRNVRISTSSTNNKVGDFSEKEPFVLNADTIRGMFQLDEFARKVEVFYGDMRKQIKLMFGIKVSDKSAMSPILVDSGSCPVQVSELTNMSGGNSVTSPDTLPLGANAGKMTAAFGKRYNTFEVEEHGIMMTCVWVRPRTCYVNKLPHFFTSFLDNTSIPNPLFAQVGERGIYGRECDFDIMRPYSDSMQPRPSYTDYIFGYNVPYVQYKYTLDTMSGDFRDNLVYWHTGRIFNSVNMPRPTTSYAFTQVNDAYMSGDGQSINRIFNVVNSIDGNRPFQLQLRFNTEIWQPYPHCDNEF